MAFRDPEGVSVHHFRAKKKKVMLPLGNRRHGHQGMSDALLETATNETMRETAEEGFTAQATPATHETRVQLKAEERCVRHHLRARQCFFFGWRIDVDIWIIRKTV